MLYKKESYIYASIGLKSQKVHWMHAVPPKIKKNFIVKRYRTANYNTVKLSQASIQKIGKM